MKTRIMLFLFLLLSTISTKTVLAQTADWRNVDQGVQIYTNGYIDQPYVVTLDNGSWLVVFTTGEGHEGTGGQHIVSSLSKDQGKTWSKPVRIEQPGKESKSWAMPYLTNYGRVYVFYDYNGDKIHSLGDRKNIREDMLGWYCYKYSDDNGKTWSERYRLPVRKTNVDRKNDWKGDVQILWGIGKPIHMDEGMMLAFTKIQNYMLENSEGWFFRCMNINTEKDPEKLNWEMLPEGENGLKNENHGTVNSEQNIIQLNDGTIYCMHRTISGFPAESYSYDRGENWTVPVVPEYYTGTKIKHPRACPRIWKTKTGKYLFWQHNHGGWDFNDRNPAWISGGIEKDGKIIWSQPEILLYEDEFAKRMSYPDLIESNGKYWVTETNKENGRCHEIPAEFLNMLWSQFSIEAIASKGLIFEADQHILKSKTVHTIGSLKDGEGTPGFTIDMVLALTDLSPSQNILSIKGDNDLEISMQTHGFGAIQLVITTEGKDITWTTDPGIIRAFGDNSIAVSVDNNARIIQFVVNGVVNNGGQFRQFGWKRFENYLQLPTESSLSMGKLKTGSLRIIPGTVKSLRLYNRSLTNTEIIGNHRVDSRMYEVKTLQENKVSSIK